MRGAPLARGVGETLRPLAVVTPVLAGVELVAGVEVSEHQLVGCETLPTPEERALETLARRHAHALVPLHGHPDHEAVEGAFIARGVSCTRDGVGLARALTDDWVGAWGCYV